MVVEEQDEKKALEYSPKLLSSISQILPAMEPPCLIDPFPSYIMEEIITLESNTATPTSDSPQLINAVVISPQAQELLKLFTPSSPVYPIPSNTFHTLRPSASFVGMNVQPDAAVDIVEAVSPDMTIAQADVNTLSGNDQKAPYPQEEEKMNPQTEAESDQDRQLEMPDKFTHDDNTVIQAIEPTLSGPVPASLPTTGTLSEYKAPTKDGITSKQPAAVGGGEAMAQMLPVTRPSSNAATGAAQVPRAQTGNGQAEVADVNPDHDLYCGINCTICFPEVSAATTSRQNITVPAQNPRPANETPAVLHTNGLEEQNKALFDESNESDSPNEVPAASNHPYLGAAAATALAYMAGGGGGVILLGFFTAGTYLLRK
ncbi:hypothetical protein BT63DRAFT_450185 [Microthyrium microscopicum]|uniref:Uncharacterized protein n=1 Tax=Microthyrium microscopicum TaxID=703497 RepID=A0A6A6UUU9_9PEZI|nr:hypothetical protein BT63DRAFT_450185 [Microthyrium microscopicum]